MLTKEKAHDIFTRLKKFSTADEVEAQIYGGHSALTRFANNTIHQNVAWENVVVSVRTAFGTRTARATTNKVDDESLKRVVEASESLAKIQHPDADLLPIPSAAESAPVAQSPSRRFEQTAAITPADRADGVAKIVDVAKRHNLTTAGIFSTAETVEGIFNSRGLSHWHTQTAAEKAAQSAAPREIPAGKYTVILEPAAVLDMTGFMFWDFGGLAILDQRSFLSNRVGAKLFGDNINIWDDVDHPLQSGSPFDGEGLPRRRLQLVENGVVKRLVYARATAARMKRSEYKDQVGPIEPTGHGFPLPNEMGEAPMNLVFAPPQHPKTIDEMIGSTERGVLVTRLWYIREVDPYEKILTGMTRDGTFYIEDGKVHYGLRNFRFNESLLHMLSSVEEMGTPVRASGEESFDMVVPAMKIREFNFTEVTKF
jgi:predicted Zn-dependent protease